MNRLNRLTRTLVNSPGSSPFIRHLRRRPGPVPRPLAGVSCAETRPSYRRRQFSRIIVYHRNFFTAAPVLQKPGLDTPNLVHSISSVNENGGDKNCKDASANAGPGDYQRKVLPEELSRSVMRLSCESSAEGGVCDVYLIGTVHRSQESRQEVQAVISYLKPQAVFLELCSSRVAVVPAENFEVPTMSEIVKAWRKQKQCDIFGIEYRWLDANAKAFSRKLGAMPDSEFFVACEEALKYGGKVILGDRPIEITLQRTQQAWARMPLWHKTKSMCSLFSPVFVLSSLEILLKKMDNGDVTFMIQEMNKRFPTLAETFIHERDQYMSFALLSVASEHSSIVAVVGKGHLQGIKKNWKQPVEMKNLLEVDTSSHKQAVSPVEILIILSVAASAAVVVITFGIRAIISGIYLLNNK